MVIVGLVFLALKPQIGLLAFVAVAALRRYRWAVFPAGVVCLLGAAAVALTADLLPSIEGFLINLTRHSQHAANTPPHLTGVIHILDSLFSVPNASFVALVIFLAGIICTAVLFHNSPFNKTSQSADAEQSIATLVLFIAFSFFIIPFHYYDMLALVAIFMMIVAVPLEGRWVIALGLLLCYRPDFIWRAFGVTKPEEIILSHLISPGLFVILIGAVWALWAARSRARLTLKSRSISRLSLSRRRRRGKRCQSVKMGLSDRQYPSFHIYDGAFGKIIAHTIGNALSQRLHGLQRFFVAFRRHDDRIRQILGRLGPDHHRFQAHGADFGGTPRIFEYGNKRVLRNFRGNGSTSAACLRPNMATPRRRRETRWRSGGLSGGLGQSFQMLLDMVRQTQC